MTVHNPDKNRSVIISLIVLSLFIVTIMLIVLSINLIFPATWSCKYYSELKEGNCICGWDNRPTNEYGFDYNESYCNSIGKIVR